MKLPSSRTYAWWLALIRIATGIFWLAHGVPKFLQSAAFLPPRGFMEDVLQGAAKNSSGLYHSFIVSVVIPHPGAFAELVRVGEVLVGCSLVFGFLTRLGGLGGCFLALNYLLSKGGVTSFQVLGGIDCGAILLSFTHLVLPTGRVFGIDALLMRRPERVAPLQPEFVDEPPR